MLQLFIIKICFTIKINTICGGAQLLVSGCLESMCYEFNSQGLGLRILELMIAGPKSEGFNFRVSGLRFQGLGSQGPGSQVLGLRVPGLGSNVLILDYAIQQWCTLSKFSSAVIIICKFVFFFRSSSMGFLSFM